jgi:hypothetical protein
MSPFYAVLHTSGFDTFTHFKVTEYCWCRKIFKLPLAEKGGYEEKAIYRIPVMERLLGTNVKRI